VIKKPQQSLKDWGNQNGEPKVVKNLLKQVNDIFQKLRSKVSALLSTLRRPKPSAPEKPPENNS